MVDPQLRQILDYLDRRRIRATYGAVAELLGVSARSVGSMLGEKRPEASWVVNKSTELPTGYTRNEMHPHLTRRSTVLKTAKALRAAMARDEKEGREE